MNTISKNCLIKVAVKVTKLALENVQVELYQSFLSQGEYVYNNYIKSSAAQTVSPEITVGPPKNPRFSGLKQQIHNYFHVAFQKLPQNIIMASFKQKWACFKQIFAQNS